MDNAEPHLLLDVRPLVEVDICHLPVSLSILLVLQAHNSLYFVMILNYLFIPHPCLYDCSPYIVARHSTLKFRGEKE